MKHERKRVRPEIREIKDVENKWTEKAIVQPCIDAKKKYDKHCV